MEYKEESNFLESLLTKDALTLDGDGKIDTKANSHRLGLDEMRIVIVYEGTPLADVETHKRMCQETETYYSVLRIPRVETREALLEYLQSIGIDMINMDILEVMILRLCYDLCGLRYEFLRLADKGFCFYVWDSVCISAVGDGG